MAYRMWIGFAIALLALSISAASADSAELELSADKDGVRVRTAGFEVRAAKSSFDEATGMLVMEGTAASPVKLSDEKELVATCLRLTFHRDKGKLILEGNREKPATLVRGKVKPEMQVQAKQIGYDLATGAMEIEDASVISLDRRQTP